MPAQCLPTATVFISHVDSPLGKIALIAEEQALCGLYLPSQAASVQSLVTFASSQPISIFDLTTAFLEAYFSNQPLPQLPSMKLRGTAFQMLVWSELRRIPAGHTRTYSEIAQAIGRPTATRAVGKSIGDNPLSILVPCHRVIGRSGSLTGYAGGLENKRWLLAHEGALLGISNSKG